MLLSTAHPSSGAGSGGTWKSLGPSIERPSSGPTAVAKTAPAAEKNRVTVRQTHGLARATPAGLLDPEVGLGGVSRA